MQVKVTVDARLRVDCRELSEPVITALKEMCTHVNPQHSKLKAMGYATFNEPRLIRTWKGGPGWVALPRGVLSKLRTCLAEHGCTPVFDDRRTDPDLIAMPRHLLQLYDYQDDAVTAAVQLENCLIRAPTGSGKTSMAMAFMARTRVPALVIVWNAALLEQWEERACKEFGLRKSDIGIVRAGKVRLKPITIAMQQSMGKLGDADRKAICSYFGTVVFDEVHRAAARTFTEVVDWMSARYRLGLSANETRKDRKEFLIYDMFGRVAADIAIEKLVAKNFVLDVEVQVHPTGCDYDWYQTSEVPYAKLLEAIVVDEARTHMAADLAAAEARAGHQVIVFSHRRDHCLRLVAALAARGVNAGLMLGGAEGTRELDAAIRGLRAGTMRVAVGTVQAVGTGIDLPSVSRGVLTTPIPSNKQLFGQVRGRLCRTAPGKRDAVLHYLYDERAFGGVVLRNLERWNDSVRVHNGKSVTSVRDYLNVLASVHEDLFSARVEHAVLTAAEVFGEE